MSRRTSHGESVLIRQKNTKSEHFTVTGYPLEYSKIIKICKEYDTCVNLEQTVCKRLSDHAKRSLVRDDTKTPVTPLTELQTSTAEMGEALHTTAVAWAC